MKNKCKICQIEFFGRSDKLFCSVKCKSYYHFRLRSVTNIVTINIDNYLHRNRSILLEILGKNKRQVKVNRIVLENKKFKFNYHTHTYVNNKGKTYNYIYDIAWMEFSDNELLIIRR